MASKFQNLENVPRCLFLIIDLFFMGILPDCSHVSTTVRLHPLEFNNYTREATWCFEQILESAPDKTEAEK